MKTTSDKKRTASQTGDSAMLIDNKKKQRAATSRIPDSLIISSRKAEFKGVKTWLELVSEKELDGLLTWLGQRKKGLQIVTAERRPRDEQKPEKSKTKPTQNTSSAPTIHRNITAKDVDQMKRHLFLEDCRRLIQPKIKLGDR